MPTQEQGCRVESGVRYDTYAELTLGRDRVSPAALAAPLPGMNVVDAHEAPLIAREPLCVRFMDHYYDASREGLYRFWNWGSVEYDHPDAPPRICRPSGAYLPTDHSYAGFIRFDSDIVKLLGGLAVLQLHGHGHRSLSYEQRKERLRMGALSLVCGDITKVAISLLAELGVRARAAYLTRLQGRWNTYNNGHVLLEFFWRELDKWVLADVDLHCLFKRGDTYLNLAELHPLVVAGASYQLEPLTPPGELLLDASDSVTSDFPGMRMFEHHLLDPQQLLTWYSQMFTAVGLREEGRATVHASRHPDAARLALYDSESSVIAWEAFVHRFYGRAV